MSNVSRWHQKGFSLTEMMVAIVILGIIVGITLPMYSRHVENTRLTQARSVALQLQQELKHLLQLIFCYHLKNTLAKSQFSKMF